MAPVHELEWCEAFNGQWPAFPRDGANECGLQPDFGLFSQSIIKSTVIKPDGYTVPARLGLEPAGCTNEAYIVRLDSMEPGNAVCCGATRVFGAYVTDFLLILCAPKRLYIPSGLNEQRIDKRLRSRDAAGPLSPLNALDGAGMRCC